MASGLARLMIPTDNEGGVPMNLPHGMSSTVAILCAVLAVLAVPVLAFVLTIADQAFQRWMDWTFRRPVREPRAPFRRVAVLWKSTMDGGLRLVGKVRGRD